MIEFAMKLRTLFLLLLWSALGVVPACAQRSSASIPPRWLHKLPTPTNSSFHYELQTAIAPTLDQARTKSLDQVVSYSGLKNGVVVVGEATTNKRVNQQWVNGRLTETKDVSLDKTISTKGSEQKLYINWVAEYWKYRHGRYTLSTVYAKSELGEAPLFDNLVLTDRYGARGFFRSLIIPGWGQMYKGSTAKGCWILGGAAVLTGGIIYTESMRQDYADKRSRTHNTSLIKSYRTKCDNWRTARNVAIGAAGALYVYNLVDALVAPGAQRIVVHNYGRGRSLTVLPTPTTDGGAALSAMIDF
jgi:hypothetical protein